MVAAGKIKQEDAGARLKGMRRMMTGLGERGESRGERRRDESERNVDWDAIRNRIEGAVDRGALTREEADAEYRKIREQRGGRGDRR